MSTLAQADDDDKTPSLRLHDALLARGWLKVRAADPRAYCRDGDRYLTWLKSGVLVATSGTSKHYDAKRNITTNSMGCGWEVTIEALITTGERQRGLGSQALTEWVGLARELGVTLYLEPVPLEDSVDKAGLVRLYRRAGFVPQGDGQISSVRVMLVDPSAELECAASKDQPRPRAQ